MTIFNFDLFTSINEKRYYIWDNAFRIDDLISAGIYKNRDILDWVRKYNFDKWAIGIFVSEKAIKTKSPISRLDPSNREFSEFGELLFPKGTTGFGDLSKIKSYLNKKEGGKDLQVQGPNIQLRKSSKDLKNKYYFDDQSKGKKGQLITESAIEFEGDTIYLFIFEKGSNNEHRARQLNGIVYEYGVKKSLGLKHSPKGEKWDAVGPLDKSYLEDKLGTNDIYLNGKLLTDLDLIPDSFLKEDNNWSIKSCSNSGSTIYFADFKRISGLRYNNGRLSLVDKNLHSFILVVGFHTAGKFTDEYIINVKIENWKNYIPDVSNREVLNKLESMYNDISEHRLKGSRTEETELAWSEFRSKYSDLTKDKDIKLNFKRDSSGQLRVQCSMSKNAFRNTLLKDNDYIHIKSK